MSVDPTELVEGENSGGTSDVESTGADTNQTGEVFAPDPNATIDPGTTDNAGGGP